MSGRDSTFVWSRLYSFCYERFLGIRTTGYAAPPVPHSGHYTPLPYRAIHRVLECLRLDTNDVFVDIGCGKGRVICCASRYPVRRVIGIELNSELVKTAELNSKRLRGKKVQIEILNVSADEYDYLDATAVYLYNPFERPIMDRVLARFERSLKRNPRNLRIAYANPLQGKCFQETGWLTKSEEWPVGEFAGLEYPISFWSSKSC